MPREDSGSSAADIATLLEGYVPRAEYDTALAALDEITTDRDAHKAEREKLSARAADLEKRWRTRAARDAFDRVADKLKINPKLRDAAFKLSELPADADEPDAAAVESHLAKWLKDQPAFVGTDPPARTLPAGDGSDRGSRVAPSDPELRVTRANLRDAVFMRDHQGRVSAAQKAGVLVIDD